MSTLPNFLAWRSRNAVFEDMGAWTGASFDFAEGPYPDRAPGQSATASFFTTLGVKASLGRTFLPEDERTGNDRVLLLTDRLWRTRFHADPGVIGSTVIVSRNQAGREKFTIIG